MLIELTLLNIASDLPDGKISAYAPAIIRIRAWIYKAFGTRRADRNFFIRTRNNSCLVFFRFVNLYLTGKRQDYRSFLLLCLESRDRYENPVFLYDVSVTFTEFSPCDKVINRTSFGIIRLQMGN